MRVIRDEEIVVPLLLPLLLLLWNPVVTFVNEKPNGLVVNPRMLVPGVVKRS